VTAKKESWNEKPVSGASRKNKFLGAKSRGIIECPKYNGRFNFADDSPARSA
jgi:hypothetical protein